MKPTSRTLDYLRKTGWTPWMVERIIPMKPYPKRVDFYGCIDIIACNPDEPPGRRTMGIQSCGTAFSEHNKKILSEPKAYLWLCADNRLMLIGWRKLKVKRGGKAMVYKPRIKEYVKGDFGYHDTKPDHYAVLLRG